MKHSLKQLAQRCLGKRIRAGDGGRHDSAEDARIAMELVQQLLKDPSKCRVFDDAMTPLSARLSAVGQSSLILDSRRSSRHIRAQSGHAVTSPRCATDSDVVAAFISEASAHNFVWARLDDLEQAMKTAADTADAAEGDGSSSSSGGGGAGGAGGIREAAASIGAAVDTMLSAVEQAAASNNDTDGAADDDVRDPQNTLVFVVGSPSAQLARSLHRHKVTGGGMSAERVEELKEAVAASREGIIYAMVVNATAPRSGSA
jgi:hypothetical protein